MGLQEDAVGWDVANWSRALDYWETVLRGQFDGLRALELGCGGNGGVSLWLASKGCEVVCSGYEGVASSAKAIHKAHSVEGRIRYAAVDACSIPYRQEFDLVCYKSVLGGIVRNGSLDIARDVTNQIQLALRPGGKLLLAENLVSTNMHRALRRQFGAGRNRWRYFAAEELLSIHSGFAAFEYTTCGVSGCLGPTERLRRMFAQLDRHVLERLAPRSWHYLMAGVATK